MKSRKKFTIEFVLWNGLLAAVCILFTFFIHNIDKLPSVFARCPYYTVAHVYCPGCGGSRAFSALLRGEIFRSLICNPAVLAGALLILYYEVRSLLVIVTGNYGRYFGRVKHRLLIGYAIAILTYTALRNILLICFQIDLMGDLAPYWI